MHIEFELTDAEAEALVQLTERLGFNEARQLTKTDKDARTAMFALIEIQQAIWQGAEHA